MFEVNVTEASKPYVMWALENGRYLSRLLLEEHGDLSGAVTAILPDRIDRARVENFNEGLVVRDSEGPTRPEDDEPAIEILSRRINRHLMGSSESICLMEDPLSDSGEPWNTDYPSRIITVGTTTYYLLTPQDANSEMVETSILQACNFSPPSVGILSYNRQLASFQPTRGNILPEALHVAARHVVEVFLVAYDGDSYLFWRP